MGGGARGDGGGDGGGMGGNGGSSGRGDGGGGAGGTDGAGRVGAMVVQLDLVSDVELETPMASAMVTGNHTICGAGWMMCTRYSDAPVYTGT